MKRLINLSLIITIVIISALINYSCTPERAPKAIILVVDENNEPIEEAMVSIKAFNYQEEPTFVYLEDGTIPIEDIKYTNKEGKVYYDFKYESIYKVEVSLAGSHNNPTLRGIGTLFLKNNETEEITIKLNEQTTF